MLLRAIRESSKEVLAFCRGIVKIFYLTIRLLFQFLNWRPFSPIDVVKTPGDPQILMSATKCAEMIRHRQLKSFDLIQSYIKRIEEVNPLINAVAFKNYEDAIEKAKEVDAKLANLSATELNEYCSKRPLLGVPFSLKDSLMVKGKPVTSGVYARRGFIAEETADVVRRMETAGAILLTITTVSEYCTWIETSSKLFGLTRNPFDLRRSAGGCSGGDAALISAGAALIGIGSDFAGSVRQPAFFNGIFALLPTPGLTPNHGHFPYLDGERSYKPIMGRISPMCRYIEDLPLVLEVMSRKPLTTILPSKPMFYYCTGFTDLLLIESTSQACLNSMYQAICFFEELFNITMKEVSFPLVKYLFEFMLISIRQYVYEPLMADMMNDSWSHMESAEQTNCFGELCKYRKGESNHSLAGILYGLTDDSDRFAAEERAQMIENRDKLKSELYELLNPHGLLFLPSFPTQATFHGELLFKRMNMCHTVFANVLGVPAIQCPMGVDDKGIPLGVMIIGAPDSEALLIDAAKKLYKEFGGWTPPGMVGSL